MNTRWSLGAFAVAFAAATVGSSATAEPVSSLPLVSDGKPACSVVVVDSPGGQWLLSRAAEAITGTVKRWSRAEVPVVTIKTAEALPDGAAIVLGTTDALRPWGDKIPGLADAIAGASAMDEQGFVCVPVGEGGTGRMFVVSRTPRGVFNGAMYLRDFDIDGTQEQLGLAWRQEARSPRLGGRVVYLLTIWNTEARYTADNWITVFDSFARDGVDRVYFWFSGHFPSQKFPQAYKCRDGKWDSTADSGIPTVEDQRKIIRAGHERGLRIYLGGALGGWVGTRFLTQEAPGTMKTPAKGASPEAAMSLCPSSPESRRALIAYYQEMFDALPEADGVFIESADEWGGCACPRCDKVVDEHGSKQFGQAQLTLIEEIMAGIWKDHPLARLSYTIGYNEHRGDPAYYRLIQQMNDPRIEWMEARDSWAFPGADGQPHPARWFFPERSSAGNSITVAPWTTWSRTPIASGTRGCTAWPPPLSPGSVRETSTKTFRIRRPFCPICCTGFVWREMTWDPALSRDQMLARVHKRFFGREAGPALAGDLWSLREILRTSAAGKLSRADREKLAPIEEHIAAARSTAGPKTVETLDLMSRAIRDIRQVTKSSAK